MAKVVKCTNKYLVDYTNLNEKKSENIIRIEKRTDNRFKSADNNDIKFFK